jgi:hypothetical protein
MKLPQLQYRASQFDYIACPAHIHPHREFFRNGEIVNRREMKHAGRLLLDQIEIGGTQRELRLADVALDKFKVPGISAAELRDPGNLLARTTEQRRLHEQDEVAVLPGESFEEPVRDEARKSGYEKCVSIPHRIP